MSHVTTPVTETRPYKVITLNGIVSGIINLALLLLLAFTKLRRNFFTPLGSILIDGADIFDAYTFFLLTQLFLQLATSCPVRVLNLYCFF